MSDYYDPNMFIQENHPWIPSGYVKLRKHMGSALSQGSSRFESDPLGPESDRYRHIMGMREATMDPRVGPIRAFLGGAGHEINNLYGALLRGNIHQLGTDAGRLGIMQVLRNSADDMYNNMIGIASAYKYPQNLSEEGVDNLLGWGVLPKRISPSSQSRERT